MNRVRYETDLYDPMKKWLEKYLSDQYKNSAESIIAVDSHSVTLETVLNNYNILTQYPQAVGVNIQVDVLGIAKLKNRADIYFIEAKKTSLSLRDLGQLWAYCKLINPTAAFLLSSEGLGGLNTILKTYAREDMLDFGNGEKLKKMHVAKWDVSRNTIDSNSIIPKL